MSTFVCQLQSIDILNVRKFDSVKQIIKDKGLAHVNNQDELMFCSPVGNQELFHSEFKANIVLSGFCVAPDAAISFAEYLDCSSSFRQATICNTFNTPNMRKGIKKIFKSIGIKNNLAFEEAKHYSSASSEKKMRFLMTQMLCMISKNGGSEEGNVIGLLENNEEIKAQAERCLCCWVKRIEEKVEPGSIILLMGDKALNLMKKTEFYKGNTCLCKICLTGKPKKNSLLSYLESKGYQVIPVYHASAINRKKLEKCWYGTEKRVTAYASLCERFDAEEIEKELPSYLDDNNDAS